jgi:hypothetical protein
MSVLVSIFSELTDDRSVECALNVLGIPSSVHDSAPSYREAWQMFREAKVRGEVSVHTACARV